MTIGIDGLVSGLDTTSLINSLMAAEAAPQTLLKTQLASTQTFIASLQSLNGKVASLASLAADTAAPDALELFSATSSSDAVTATATTGAAAGSLDITVDQVAKAQTSVSAAMTAWPGASGTSPVITIVASDGTSTEITANSTSLDDVVTAINAADAGVRAMKVASGTDASGNPQYRLQFTATTTGAASAFDLYAGTAADVTAGTATDMLAQTGAAQIQAASDAQVTLWSGTAAQQSVTSSSNTFTSLLPGVNITVSDVSTSPVTIDVQRDAGNTAGKAQAIVDALNDIFATIAASSTVTTTENSSGTVSVTGGKYTGDSTVQEVDRSLLAAASDPVGGRSPSEIGISITRNGSLEFDSDKFTAALASDPAGTKSALQQIAARVQTAAETASDKYDGTLTQKINGQQSLADDTTEQIAEWDDRLAMRRSTLESKYHALEVQLSTLKSQSSWLAAQVASMPSLSPEGS